MSVTDHFFQFPVRMRVVRMITFERNDLWPWYSARWFIS